VTTVGIVNVTGYAGIELARLLARHPHARLTQVTGRSEAGKPLAEVFPHLAELDLTIQPEIAAPCDVVFVALPHKAAAAVVPELLASGARVIDISADFRLHDPATYEEWYQVTHPCPELLAEAVYGLPELHRDAVRQARLVANPGCYPTAGILGLAPVAHLLAGPAIVDAKSGVSGGGRSLTLTQELGELRQRRDLGPASVLFLPHLIPMTRGILATCYATLQEPLSTAAVQELYRDFYRTHPFTRVVSRPPQTKQTYGSNLCLIYPTVDRRTGQLIVVSCLDNLVKGASGQAIQNMNLMLGLDECTGVDVVSVYP
jgi:N-acetyl-gamma-glutamyl-phosphate reductase